MKVQSKRLHVTEEIRKAVLRQLDNGVYYGGEQAYHFERELAAYLDARRVVVVNSGTSALLVAAIALGIERGDEVIIPANSYVSCAEVIAFLGATPVFCDVIEATGNIDVEKIQPRMTARTKAIFVTHLYGHPVEMDALLDLAKRSNLRTVEVCAHALGAEYKGRKVGGLADIGILSLGSKSISVAATGGAIVTQSDDFYQKACTIYRHGWPRKDIAPEFFDAIPFGDSPNAGMFPLARDSVRPGLNLQLDEIPCAIGRISLRSLDEWNARRRQTANLYSHLISAAGLPVSTPIATENIVCHAFLHYVIRADRRDELMQFMVERDIEALVHYPVPIPEMKYYAQHFPTKESVYPTAKRLAGEIMSLPIHPWITDDEVGYVVQTMQEFYRT